MHTGLQVHDFSFISTFSVFQQNNLSFVLSIDETTSPLIDPAIQPSSRVRIQ